MSETAESAHRRADTRLAIGCAWLTAVAIVAWREVSRLLAAHAAGKGAGLEFFANPDPDTTLFVPLLAVAPLVWWQSVRSPDASSAAPAFAAGTTTARALLPGLVMAAAAFGSSLLVSHTPVTERGVRFGDLPPAYHDEYSYLFQARTFLAGRTSWPSQGPAGLFDQMHVLNDGRFASRYFPATGLWMSPFVAVGQPDLGHQLANALVAGLLTFLAARVAGLGAGLICGLLLAAAPGMAIFSNLLLAHHPALLGLSLFLVAISEARRHRPLTFGLVAGAGLAFAMLARPMTAAGVALPFGLHLAWQLLTNRPHRQTSVRLAAGLGAALACGFILLGAYNQSITGHALTTPYQVYTERYTPRHVYGFNNVQRGSRVPAPHRVSAYDDWAANLTPRLAAANVVTRVESSFRWTLGLVPNTLLAIFALVTWRQLRTEARLLLAAVLSLHLVHVPYWFDGIMHYHYVFESGALWCVLAGILTSDLAVSGVLKRRRLVAVWATACIAAALVPAWVELPNPFVANAPLFPATQVREELRSIAFSRLRYDQFRKRLRTLKTPALVLVQHDPSEIHIEFVNNAPSLEADILTGHASAFSDPLEAAREFPDRTIYLFDVRSNSFRRITDIRPDERTKKGNRPEDGSQ